jgi:hypothetical protein
MSNEKTKISAAFLTLLLMATTSAAQGAGGMIVFNQANGHHYEVVQSTVTWDQARIAAESVSHLGVQGHLVTLEDSAEDTFVYFNLIGGALGNAWLGLYQDMNDSSYSEPAGGWKWVTGEPLTYSNWYPGEPNNGGNTEHYAGYWPADQWNDYVLSSGNVGRYVIEYDTATAIPFCDSYSSTTGCPCGNVGSSGEGCANSMGWGASLTAGGTSSVTQSDLHFISIGLIPSQPSILFQGDQALAGGHGLLFGDGLRCVGVNVKRMGIRPADAVGSAMWVPALGPPTTWVPGDVQRFQVWYGNSLGSPCGTGFNTTNAIEVTFLP